MASVETRIVVHCHADRPGIERIEVGDFALFESGPLKVLHATIMSVAPLELTVGEPKMAVAWREEGREE